MPPPSTAIYWIIGLVLSGSISLTGWGLVAIRLWTGRPALETEPRPLAPRPVLDTVLHALTIPWMILVGGAVFGFFQWRWNLDTSLNLESMDPEQRILTVKAGIVASVASLLAALPVVLFRYSSHWRDLGREFSKVPRDILLGVVAFCMLAVPVLLLHMLLTQFWQERHPLIEIIMQDPDSRFIIAAVVAAVVVAPVYEEFLFRVLIQGLLERLSTLPGWQLIVDSHQTPAAPTNVDAPPPADAHPGPVPADGTYPLGVSYLGSDTAQPGEPSERPSAPQAAEPFDPQNPWVSPQEPAPDLPAVSKQVARPPAYWPILISALLFAMMHLGQGPAPISLFVLALGLGYVYRCTHRVLPCMVIHFCLNGLSMLQLWQIVSGGGN